MYICICRGIDEKKIQDHAAEPENLGLTFAEIAEKISDESFQCGQCESIGDEIVSEVQEEGSAAKTPSDSNVSNPNPSP